MGNFIDRIKEYKRQHFEGEAILTEEEAYEILDAFEPGMDDPVARRLDEEWDGPELHELLGALEVEEKDPQ